MGSESFAAAQNPAWGPRCRALEWSVYLSVAVVGVLPALLAGAHVVGDGVDLYGTLWFFWWIRDCVEHLRDPSFTDLFFFPLGKDIFAHTGNNFVDALVSVPFQWVFGFPHWQPVFTAVLLIGNAWTFRRLAHRVIGPGAGAFVATALWQTSSYALFEITAGRPTQALLWFLPLAIERWLAFEASGRWRDAALAGLFWALQAWTYWFMAHFIGAALLWLWLGVRSQTLNRGRFLAGVGLCASSALLVAAPGLVAMWLAASDGRVPGLSSPEAALFDLPGSVDNNVSTKLHGYWQMERLGCPMLLHLAWIGGIGLALLWGRQRWRWLGLATITLFFAFGPTLPIGGPEGALSLPYLAAYHTVPFFDRLWFPYRLLSVVFLALSLAIGLGVAGITQRFRFSPRLAGLLAVSVITINLAEQNRWMTWPFVHRNVQLPAVFEIVAEHGGGVIHLPLGVNQPAIIWQTQHGQPVFGGMGENARALWPEGFDARLKLPFMRYLARAVDHPERATLTKRERGRTQLVEEGFRWVVLHRDLVESVQFQRSRMAQGAGIRSDLGVAATRALVDGLGDPVAVEGALVLWQLTPGSGQKIQVPTGLAPSPERLYQKSWTGERPPAYEDVLRSRGRLDALIDRDLKDSKQKRDHRPGQ